MNNPDIVQSPEKLLPILIFLGGGLGLSCAALLKIVSSLAKSDKTINVPTANGLIAGLGPVGANIFTLGGGSLATRYPNNPGQGYIDILYIVIGLACMSGSLTFGLTLLDKFLSKRDTENNKKYQSVLFKEDNISECAEPKTVELTGSAELILLEEKPKEGDEIAGQFIAL